MMKRVSQREMRRVVASQNLVAKSFLKRQKGEKLERLYAVALKEIEMKKKAKKLTFERELREIRGEWA